MAEQNEWRPFEVQPKPSLPIPPREGTYHQGLQNTVEPFGATGQGREIATISLPA